MSLPFELYKRVFAQLNLSDFFNLKLVSKYFKSLVSSIKWNKQVVSCSLNCPNNIMNIKVKPNYTSYLYEDELEWLWNLDQLESFSFNYIDINSRSSIYLRGLTNLTSLDLSNSTFNDFVMSHIEHLSNLESLNLSQSSFESHQIFYVAQLKKLKTLNLSSNNLDYQDFENHLFTIDSLTDLNIEDCLRLPDNDVGEFSLMKNLKRLTFGSYYDNNWRYDTSFYASGIEQLTQLEELNITVGDIDIELFDQLNSLSNLKRLSIKCKTYDDNLKLTLINLEELSIATPSAICPSIMNRRRNQIDISQLNGLRSLSVNFDLFKQMNHNLPITNLKRVTIIVNQKSSAKRYRLGRIDGVKIIIVN